MLCGETSAVNDFLELPVPTAELVRRVEAGGPCRQIRRTANLGRDRPALVRFRDQRVERVPLDPLHGHVKRSAPLADVVNAHDVGMVDAPNDLSPRRGTWNGILHVARELGKHRLHGDETLRFVGISADPRATHTLAMPPRPDANEQLIAA